MKKTDPNCWYNIKVYVGDATYHFILIDYKVAWLLFKLLDDLEIRYDWDSTNMI
jgi:hypothetical protein